MPLEGIHSGCRSLIALTLAHLPPLKQISCFVLWIQFDFDVNTSIIELSVVQTSRDIPEFMNRKVIIAYASNIRSAFTLLVNIPLHRNNSPSSILSVTHSHRTARIMSHKFIFNWKRIKICGHGWLRFGEVNGRDERLPRHKPDFRSRTSQARDENGSRSFNCLIF